MSFVTGLAVVATFQSAADAEIAKGILNAVGVDSLIRSDAAYPAPSPIELLVRAAEATKARHTLAHATPTAEQSAR